MTRRDKPFVVFRRASGMFTIVPRGFAGWAQLGVWLALLIPLAIWFAEHFALRYGGPDFASGVGLFLFALIGGVVCFLWWVFSRAEQIDMGVWLRDQQRKQRKKQRED